MSGMAERSGAFLAFALPPYWMRIPAATDGLTWLGVGVGLWLG
jgi:hypothetical protein